MSNTYAMVPFASVTSVSTVEDAATEEVEVTEADDAAELVIDDLPLTTDALLPFKPIVVKPKYWLSLEVGSSAIYLL